MHQPEQLVTNARKELSPDSRSGLQAAEYFREYTSAEAISKYTRATAGYGISYLLDHDYKEVYLRAIDLLPDEAKKQGLRILEFGCGGGMNLLHLMSVLKQQGIRVEQAIGTDFSPVLIEAAQREAKNFLVPDDLQRLEFHQAKNESLLTDLSVALKTKKSDLQGAFDFIFGVNTIRYCHDAGTELDCAKDIFELLVPGGVCVAIDMNCRFPLFRSDLRNRLRRVKEEECYVASLDEYAEPFTKTGFALERKEHFCWIPHSSGKLLCGIMRFLSPALNIVAPTRAMRALVVARKPM
jgi:SAM-dependent methyltransferase